MPQRQIRSVRSSRSNVRKHNSGTDQILFQHLHLLCSFKELYRLNKPAFSDLLSHISHHYKPRRSDAIPTVLKLTATLRFLAEGGYQRGVGQDFLLAMSQPTVSAVIAETLDVLERIKCAEEIHFKMTDAEKTKSKQHFYGKYGFPGIIGCVDGTHVAIIRPTDNEHHFFNRKGWHSINAMVVSLFLNLNFS